jgi:3',5'-cyclic-AMP phosphodiesterase
MQTDPIRILQISDTHLSAEPTATFYGLNTESSFLATLDHIKSSSFTPDICLMTGDLSQDHSTAAYQRLTNHLNFFQCPIYWIPGNHDTPETMEQALAQTQLHADKSILVKNWQIILLNSHKPKSAAGYLSKTELAFLDAQLQRYPNHHTCVVLHHHPIKMGSQWLDNVGLENAAEFFGILDSYQHVRGIVFGHVHQESESLRNNIPLFSVPSTCFQFLPKSTPFALDISAHPGYRQIELFPDGTIKTHVERIKHLTGTIDPNASGYTADNI